MPTTMSDFVASAETHTGAVLFVGDLAYKIKKPVQMSFVDWRRLEDRRLACEREVALNRRLVRDVYLGVGELRPPAGAAEPAVVMRRLPDDRRLSTLVRAGADVDAPLRHLAHQLAAFHLDAPSTPVAEEEAGVTATWRRWETNQCTLIRFVDRFLDRDVAGEVIRLARRYLAGRAALFEKRIADGRARDGHGDLLADDIFCLPDGPRALDCLDFDERLRVGDVLADVAFLTMDLERLGRPDLGDTMLRLHRELTDDHWPDSLAHHHVAYRAQVRAMVAALRAEQGDAASVAEARQLLVMARDHLRAGRVRLVLVGGAPATGKSTLAAGIGSALHAVVLRSDEVRKALAGLPVTECAAARLGEGIYTHEWTARTYEELLRRARGLLAMGESVVLDASWLDPSARDAARRVASATTSDVAELQCVLPVEEAARRAAARADVGTDASDAGPAIARALARRATSWPEATSISTAGPVASTLRQALIVLEEGPC
jgi:aminoglycoside phosphotransferase family enzyme/predicted kinase